MLETQSNQRWWKLSAMSLLLAAAFLVPRRVEATIYCLQETRTTATVQKKGVTCADAKQKVSDYTYTEAENTCYSSGFDFMCGPTSVTYTTACTYDAGLQRYFVSGYRTFQCGVNVP